MVNSSELQHTINGAGDQFSDRTVLITLLGQISLTFQATCNFQVLRMQELLLNKTLFADVGPKNNLRMAAVLFPL